MFLIEGRASPDFSVPLAICCLICSVICLNNGALLSLAIKIFKPTNISPQFYLTVYTQYIQLNKIDRKSTRLNSSHVSISYAVFCLKKKKKKKKSIDT